MREAIVFAGLADPGETREELQLSSDRDAASMRTILEEMERLDPQRHGLTAAELIQRSHDDPTANAELRGAIEELCGKLDSRKLGGRFRHFQRRNFGGKMLDKSGTDRTKTSRWAVFTVGSPAPLSPDAGDAGDAGSIPGENAKLKKEEVTRRRAVALAEAKKKISEAQLFDLGSTLPD